MSAKDTLLEYTVNAVRRQVGEICPDLFLHFVIFDPALSGRKTKITDKAQELPPDHPATPTMEKFLENYNSDETEFTAIALATQKSLPFTKQKESFLGVCRINLQIHQDKRKEVFPDAPDKYDRIVAYSLAWKALNALENYKKKKKDTYALSSNILTPVQKPAEKLRANLLSECFATMLMEQQGETGTIRQFMKQRCKMSISKTRNAAPEDYPFPIAFDAIRLTFSDLRTTGTNTAHLMKHTMSMNEEINNTYDDITLRQWREFCLAAQEMAWMDRSKSEILSAATYTSDDAHMRTTAYIIAESLSSDVKPLNNPQFYNPFADQEKYERLHHKTANTMFENLIDAAVREERPEILLQQALLQNKALFEGQVIGWCAPALVKTCKAYSKTDDRIKELLQEIFTNVLNDTKWGDIRRLNRFIMFKKREETPLTSDLILKEYIREKEDLKYLAEAFSST